MTARPGSRGSGPGKGRSGASSRSAARSLSATRRPARPGTSGPATARTDSAPPAGSDVRRGTRQVAPRAGQRRRAAAMVGSPLARQIVALGLALAAVALSLAYPLRGYVQQQAAEREALAAVQQLEAEKADLEAQVAALGDPAYIRAEAKRRLQYVSPGDTVYVVKLPKGVAAAESDGGPVLGAETVDDTDDAPADAPWYQTLWGTLVGDDAGGSR